jgi:hypothetical protein
MKRSVFVLLLCIAPFISKAQNGYFIEPIVNPLVLTMGNGGLELGENNTVNMSHEVKNSPEFVLNVGKAFSGTKWSAGVGLSVKSQQHDFEYENYAMEDGALLLEPNSGYIKQSFIGYRLFSSYQFTNKLACRLIVELADPVRVEKSNESNSGTFTSTEFIDGESITVFDVEKNESFSLSGSLYSHVIPEMQISYNVYKSVCVNGGVKFNLLNRDYKMYDLSIEGQTDNMPETHVVNNSSIYSRFTSVYFGLKYNFEL